jgi:hypothetical protein
MNGSYIAKPIVEADLQAHVRNSGRLWQPTKSLDPKKIREMVGQGLAGNPRPERETRVVEEIKTLTQIFIDGLGPHSGPTSDLGQDFEPGDGVIYAEDELASNTWYLVGGRVFLKVGAGTEILQGTCSDLQYENQTDCLLNGETWTVLPSLWRHPIIERLTFPGAEVSRNIGSSISFFNGFSNGERASKIATNQSFFDNLFSGLQNLIGRWKTLLNREIAQHSILLKDDPEFTNAPTIVNQNRIALIDAYIANGYPLEDGPTAIGDIRTQCDDRLAYIPTRVATAKSQKGFYYNDRIQLTNSRANRQSGTLFRSLFVSETARDFPPSGDPNLIAQINRVERRLKQIKES